MKKYTTYDEFMDEALLIYTVNEVFEFTDYFKKELSVKENIALIKEFVSHT